jgi:hypothetical protein
MKRKFLFLHILIIINFVFLGATCLYCIFSGYIGDNPIFLLLMLLFSYGSYKGFKIEAKIKQYVAYEMALFYINIIYLYVSLFNVSDYVFLVMASIVMLITVLYCKLVLN